MADLKEKHFEEIIYNYFADSPLYIARTPEQYDKEKMFDIEMLTNFLKQTQPKEWAKLEKQFPDSVIDAVMEEFKRLRNARGILEILRFGFPLRGAKLKFAYFRPASGFNEEHRKKYEANRFSVVRQFSYSSEHNKIIDLVILLNGIPIISMELKNEFTGQNVHHAIMQYCDPNQRDHRDLFLKGCLVHFAVDNKTVFMTTKLAGNETFFLPFNRDTKNPVIEGKFASSYLWEKILQADSLLNILQNFIMHQKNDKGEILLNKPLIFPRYHQLDVVRELLADAKETGSGKNYLIQHSAGSGKSKSIAWLAHQLSNLFDAADKKIFDSVIVITDRRVLDQQLQKDILEFEKTKGVVEAIGRGKTSRHLVEAIETGAKIIVSTLQKFGTENIAKIADLGEKRFAVIVDEAHSSQTGENVKDLKVALTSDEQLNQIMAEEDSDNQDPVANALERIMKQRQKLPHLSFFAFTATPKPKTFEIFGIADKSSATAFNEEKQTGYRAFHYYTMRQAIEEGFILDVLANYTTYGTYFELVENSPEDKKREFEKGKAKRLLLKEVGKHPHSIDQKVHIMLNHFMQNTVHKINGRAKAMVVTSSRVHAVLYKKAFDRILNDEYNNYTHALVAFSGSVQINDEDHKYTEENMNPHDAKDIKKAFESDKYRILIVANKFQTGFDQPLLHTMYVEKKLGGVATVQTLSRLNRKAPNKHDTMVLDFVNDHESVKADFQDYYQSTMLDKGTDGQKLYNLKFEIEKHNLFTQDDIEKVINLLVSHDAKADRISPIIQEIVNHGYLPLSPDDKIKFRKKLNNYIRAYSFLSQIITFVDADLEKFYLFTKLLAKNLPYEPETLPLEVTQMVNMDKFAVEELLSENILLEKKDEKLENPQHDGHGGKKPKYENLEVIVTEINEQFGYDFKDFHKVMKDVKEYLKKDEPLRATMNAKDIGDVKKMKFEEVLQNAFIDNIDSVMEIMTKMDEDKAFGKHLKGMLYEWFKNEMKQDEPQEA